MISYSCLAVAENEPNCYPSLTDLFSIWNSGVSFDVVEVILRAAMAWVNKLVFKDGPVLVLDSYGASLAGESGSGKVLERERELSGASFSAS